MIDALIMGKLHGEPVQRISKAGKPFATARLLVPCGEAQSVFVSVICFSESVQAQLLELKSGEAVAVAATLTPKAYIDKHGDAAASLDATAHQITTVYHVKRKREAMEAHTHGARQQSKPNPAGKTAVSSLINNMAPTRVADMDEDLPF